MSGISWSSVVITILLLSAGMAAAQDTSVPAGDSSPAPVAETLTRRLDPADFKSRIELRYEHQNLHDGGSRGLLVPRYEYAFSKTLAARIEVPYVWNRPDGAGSDRGLGDVILRLNYRALRGDGYALVLAPELSLDTADEGLGINATVFQPVAFASIDMPQISSVLFPYAQQFIDIAGKNDVSISLLRLGLLSRLPQRFYTFVEPSFYVDWERDQRTGFTLELEIGRLLSKNLAIWGRPGVGTGGKHLPYVYAWNFEIGFRYFLD